MMDKQVLFVTVREIFLFLSGPLVGMAFDILVCCKIDCPPTGEIILCSACMTKH